MTTLEETGIQIRTAVLELQKLANTTRITDPETASKIDGIANNITEVVDGKKQTTPLSTRDITTPSSSPSEKKTAQTQPKLSPKHPSSEN